ncbi:MAG: hypothetical protein AMJ41_02350 [candidate division Zixibacteria bacterium DG_27]|nr:MAG: hypothetical protein AMJ41_02350 [candidate division Zixibacteria bacterium DG_27]
MSATETAISMMKIRLKLEGSNAVLETPGDRKITASANRTAGIPRFMSIPRVVVLASAFSKASFMPLVLS